MLTVSDIRALFAKAEVSEIPGLLMRFAQDERAGVQHTVDTARRRLHAAETELARLEAMMAVQIELENGGVTLVAGVDEVGRGALAGPVSAAAVILPSGARIQRLNDSKKLTPVVREALAEVIAESALAVSVAHVWPKDIDALGIAAANTLAMRSAITGLSPVPDHVIADGLRVDLGFSSTFVVGGDARCACVAAASIVAKVARDALMRTLDEEHPGYDVAANKGYGTEEHIQAIRQLGPSPIHRLSFSPCSQECLF